MSYGSPPGGGGYGGPPPGGYGGPPPGGFGSPPPDGYGGPPPGGYGAPMGPYGAAPSPYAAPPPFGSPMAMQMGAPYGIEPMTGMPYSDKSKVVAGLLQLFVGWCGIGRFYTGHIGIGIAQIVVFWASCGVGIIWPIVDGIMMLTGRVTDSEGRPLRDG